mmetsp:Transcript_34041/g.80652  ORF Transcript_34041/g.80652 Transcript_34041/m.80652 type:complete len:231 (-) Transcript_34041:854-1546(-)
MRMFCSEVELLFTAPFLDHPPSASSTNPPLASVSTSVASVRFPMASLYFIWVSERGAKRRYSRFLGSKPARTSDLRRRSRKGSRIVWSFEMVLLSFSSSMMRWVPPSLCRSSSNANQSLNVARSWKISGRMKLRSDHSSERLFCSGVPESSRRLSAVSVFSSRSSRQSLFLRRWPSSTTMYFQCRLHSFLMSFIATSKEVMTTGYFLPGFAFFSNPLSLCICSRSSLDPW